MNKLNNKEIMKIKKTVTLDIELIKWIEQKVKEKEFASVSHAIEKALFELKKHYEKQ
jgi:Arc/MetJ-type ribon-helix-helix transcriptional regulator